MASDAEAASPGYHTWESAALDGKSFFTDKEHTIHKTVTGKVPVGAK